MSRVAGIVEEGRVVLPESVRLPEGARVIVYWSDEHPNWGPPFEPEALTSEDIREDIEWARTWNWRQPSS